MELWQLRTFTTVAKTLHFRRASEELNLSQPAVSHQIKALEEEIGEPLFLRQKEGVLLTKAGQTMFRHALKILDTADEMRLEISENKEKLAGILKIGAVSLGLENPSPAIYAGFRAAHSDIEINFDSKNELREVIEGVSSGSLDIGLVPQSIDLEGLASVPYGDYEMVFVVGKDHPLAGKKMVSPEDIANEEWVMFGSGNRLRQYTEEALAKAGIKPANIYEANDGWFIISMVSRGLKVAFLPKWGIYQNIAEGRIIPVEIEGLSYRVRTKLIWQANRRSKQMSAFITYLLDRGMEGIDPIKPEP